MPSGHRWSVEQRIAFAERRLFWDGSLNREDLMRRFGISANQATADVSRARARHPEGIAYNTVAKRYETQPGFKPAAVSADDLLTELRLIAERQLHPEESTLSSPPSLAIAEAPTRSVEASVLRVVLAAIRDGVRFEAEYASFQRPEIARRSLSPHALVFDGFRWHVRAHDLGDGRFKDFVLARLDAPGITLEPGAEPAADLDWHENVPLTLVPHPGLEPHQRAVVIRDYGMGDEGRLTLKVRRAVVFYVRKRLGLLDGHEARPAKEQHIVLASPVGEG